MLFWIVAGGLAAVVALMVARPLLAPPGAAAEAPDVAVYRAQLGEVERDLARGVLAPAEAERVRVEVARRLLAADRAGPRPSREAPRAASLVGVAMGAGALVVGSLALYATLGAPGAADAPRSPRVAAAEAARGTRPSQAEAEAAVPPAPVDAPAEYLAVVDELRRVVPQRAQDLRGWELLALHEARLGRYADAARAQARVVALKGEAAGAADHVGLADRLVAAAGGLVTPEAEAALAPAAAREPRHPGVLYYQGLLHAQVGRPDLAFPLWRAAIEGAPPGDLHRTLAEGQIADVAWLAGRDWAPPAAAPAEAPLDAPPGPSEADVAAAAEMEPEAQAAMIRGMVESLRARLLAEGGAPDEWARLVGAQAVLGDAAGAAEALALARAAHAGDAAGLARLDEAAQAAGIGG